MEKVGLHIRLTNTIMQVIDKALRLEIPFFQTFVTLKTGKQAILDEKDVKEFLKLRELYFKNLYLHGSYWINLCTSQPFGMKILKKELLMAKKLEFTHIVLHPGAAIGGKTKDEGIDLLAKALNEVTKNENEVSFVLENTAHGNLSIGGDINELYTILSKLDFPEKVSFCIDTAHAYSYGYNIADINEQENFINLLENTIGTEKISLIHLNDTHEKLGSKIDKHHIIGHGHIGQEALKHFINHNKIKDIPKLAELPIIEEEQEKDILNKFNKFME